MHAAYSITKMQQAIYQDIMSFVVCIISQLMLKVLQTQTYVSDFDVKKMPSAEIFQVTLITMSIHS